MDTDTDKQHRRRVVSWAMGALSVDLISKMIAVDTLGGKSHKVEAAGLHWSLAYDPGDSISPYHSPLLEVMVLHIAMLGVLIVLAKYGKNIIGAIGAGLSIGGLCGNWLDLSVGNKTVVDFIGVGAWKIFNLADFCVILGVVMLGVGLISRRVAQKRADEAAPTSSAPNEEVAA